MAGDDVTSTTRRPDDRDRDADQDQDQKYPGGRSPAALVGATPDAAFTITFDGRELTALPGQSLAAALWSAGILAWRRTRIGGRPRGAFCGIGQCYDCLATVNGRPNRRACLVTARPGDAVSTQEGDGHAGLAV